MITTALSSGASALSETAPTLDPERERLHRQMLSSVSHDLKTPLAAIIGSLEVIERVKEKLPVDKQLTLIHVALQEAYRLDSFITNILDMARLESGVIVMKPDTADLGALLHNCFMRMDNQLRGSTVKLQPSTSLEVRTDPVLLSRTICLLLDNAVKYGGAPAVIQVEYGCDENTQKAFISIRDNGQGVPEDRMKVIFSKYTRFAKEDQQNAGTGLGLAIASGIMRVLGGTIDVRNQAEGGAAFTLNFPARAA